MRNRSHNSRRRFRVEQQRPHAPARIEARAHHAHGAFVSPLQWEVERAWPLQKHKLECGNSIRLHAQALLDELLLRFTDKHPDVIAARRMLEDLKKREEAGPGENTKECQQDDDGLKKRQYHALADRLHRARWSDQALPCYRLFPMKLADELSVQ